MSLAPLTAYLNEADLLLRHQPKVMKPGVALTDWVESIYELLDIGRVFMLFVGIFARETHKVNKLLNVVIELKRLVGQCAWLVISDVIYEVANQLLGFLHMAFFYTKLNHYVEHRWLCF
jgi:hypothetical protein